MIATTARMKNLDKRHIFILHDVDDSVEILTNLRKEGNGFTAQAVRFTHNGKGIILSAARYAFTDSYKNVEVLVLN